MESAKIVHLHKVHRETACYVGFHSHPETEVVFYQNGKGKSRIGGKEYDFSDGSLAVINKGIEHDEEHFVASDVIFMTFLIPDFDVPDGIYNPKNFFELKQIAMQIYEEINFPKYDFERMISAKTEVFRIMLMRGILNEGTNEKMEECVKYLNEHCVEDLDMRAMAEKFNMGYEKFRHDFKRLHGISPKGFVVNKRIIKASDMLIETKLSCTDIAYECGFADSSQFSKIFKRQFGSTPVKFRENKRM